MDSNGIFHILCEQLFNILPHLAKQTLTREDSLQALGANSMDRAEIIIETLAACSLHLPMVCFGRAKNMGDIVDVIVQGLSKQNAPAK